MRDYKKLEVWKLGINLCKKIYEVTQQFPKEELFGLTSQMRRSAVSIPSNIAEGYARQHDKELIQFLSITFGSCAELETQVLLSFEMSFMSKESFDDLTDKIDHLNRMLFNLKRKI